MTKKWKLLEKIHKPRWGQTPKTLEEKVQKNCLKVGDMLKTFLISVFHGNSMIWENVFHLGLTWMHLDF